MDFIHKLDSARYRDFQGEVKRAEDMGQAASVPVTLATAVSLCLVDCVQHAGARSRDEIRSPRSVPDDFHSRSGDRRWRESSERPFTHQVL